MPKTGHRKIQANWYSIFVSDTFQTNCFDRNRGTQQHYEEVHTSKRKVYQG